MLRVIRSAVVSLMASPLLIASTSDNVWRGEGDAWSGVNGKNRLRTPTRKKLFYISLSRRVH
jgi:hypothetical protein